MTSLLTSLNSFALFVAICVLILLLQFLFKAYTGGWHKLASYYKHYQRETTGVLKWKSGKLHRSSNYGILDVKGMDEGLYLATNVFFSMGHPPLLMPWDRLLSAEITRTLFDSTITLIIASPYNNDPILTIRLDGSAVVEQLTPFLKTHGLLSAE